MRAMRMAVLVLATLFVGFHVARADDRGRSTQSRGFDSRHDFRRDGFRRDFRFDPRRYCWCGFDFYRFPGHHHHHDRFPGDHRRF